MLEIHNLGVRYGRHIALEGVSARIEKGEIVVMLGANGAGKSTLLKAVGGLVSTEPGTEIVMNGKPIRGMKAHRIVEEGIALVPEGRGIFGDLTVAENLQLGAFAQRARGDETATLKRIYELFPRLGERKRQVARTMSGGEQQMVAIGRALMSKPDILMLDEPSLGLSPLLSKELFKSLKAVAATGVGILLVEQNARLSLKIADRGYLVENGLITGEDTAVNLMSDPAVANAYLGGKAEAREPRTARRGIVLPPFLGIPSGFAGLSRAVGDLARRAGAIREAFTRYLRREETPPSAFVGRYDPRSGPDPWEALATTARAAVPQHVEVDAAGLARRAEERLRQHLEASRLTLRREPASAPENGPVPPGLRMPVLPGRRPSVPVDAAALAARAQARLKAHLQRGRTTAISPVQPAPARQAGTDAPVFDAGALAARAADRLSTHLAERRAARPVTPVQARPARSETPHETAADPDLRWLGHNSAGIDIDAEETGPAARHDDIGDLAARAAEIHAAHVARRRQKLTAFTISPNRSGIVATNDKSERTKEI